MEGYIDLHTHLFSADPSVWAIRSFHQQEKREAEHYTGPRSVGLHPWFLEAGGWEEDWEWVERESVRSEVVAIGETGLDRLQGPDLSLQEEIFLRHIRLAEACNKPVIVHCVRAWSELERIVRSATPSVPVVVHGFQKDIVLMEKLLSLGVFFSFGAAILRENSTAAHSFAAVPLDRVFLETDDGQHPIQTIYGSAAALRGLTESALAAQIHINLQTIGIHE